MLILAAGLPRSIHGQVAAPLAIESADSAPHVDRPGGQAQRRLARLDLLIERQAWHDVVDAADELLAAPVDGWVSLGNGRYCGLREAVQRKLSAMSPVGLTAYRERVDPVAEQWLQRGVEQRDERLLWQAVDQAFCSSYGDDALWALGEILLERGCHQLARAVWSRVKTATAGEQLAYPDSPIPLAEVQARLALVSIRQGDWRRAAAEIEVLQREHAAARGRLGGQDIVLAEWLRAELKRARQWPPLKVNVGNWPTLLGSWQRCNERRVDVPSDAKYEQAWSVHIDSPPLQDGGRSPLVRPIIVGGVVYFQDGAALRAVRLEDGENLGASGSEVAKLAEGDSRPAAANLTAVDGNLFAVIPGTGRAMAFDLGRHAARIHQYRAGGQRTTFAGHALVHDDRVIVCEVSQQHATLLEAACFDLWRGDQLWRRSVGWAFTGDDLQFERGIKPELSANDGVVFVSSGLGMVAAIRAVDGEPLWLQTYERSGGHIDGQPHACRLRNSMVVARPPDSSSIVALDAASGVVRWQTPEPSPLADILAVDEEYVLLQGDRLRRLSLRAGKLAPEWGRGVENAVGLGTVAGNLIYWPTALEVLIVNRQSGEPTGESLLLPSPGGANIVVVESCVEGQGTVETVLAAGDRHITAYRRAE